MSSTIILGINHTHKKLSIKEQINALPDNSFFVIIHPDFESCGGDIFWKLAEAGIVVHVPSGAQCSAFVEPLPNAAIVLEYKEQ